MRIIFMGTPQFAVPSLEVVLGDHDVVAVVTQPDRRQGRGQQVAYSKVKQIALKQGLPVLQPKRVGSSENVQQLKALNADICVIVAFGQKIPNTILNMTPNGCINVHSSLLPKYRGAAPINYAIAQGETKTGVTTMYLSEAWDAGDIILQETEPIYPHDTAGNLHDRLMIKGAKLLAKTLEQIATGVAPRLPQDDNGATYAYKLTKNDGLVDFRQTAHELDCLVRAMNPWPVAHTIAKGEQLRIWKAKPVEGVGKIGRVESISDVGLIIGCADGLLALVEVQRPNSRIISGRDLANGLHLTVGDYLVGDAHD